MDAEERIRELEARVAELDRQVGRLADIEAIRRLQYQYGYYLDKMLYEEVADLFAADGEVHFLHGVWKGKAGVERLYCGRFRDKFAGGHNGPAYGQLLDHPQYQGVIDVAEDGRTAKARFRMTMQAGSHQSIGASQRWEGGIYENTYVKEDGTWKFQVLEIRQIWHCSYEHGWAYMPMDYPGWVTTRYPDDPSGPDELEDTWRMFPDMRLFDFHYPHPITGEWVTSERGGPETG